MTELHSAHQVRHQTALHARMVTAELLWLLTGANLLLASSSCCLRLWLNFAEGQHNPSCASDLLCFCHLPLLPVAGACTGSYRPEWKPFGEATACTPCGEGVKAAKTDQVTVYNIVTLEPSQLQISSSSEDCCKCRTCAAGRAGWQRGSQCVAYVATGRLDAMCAWAGSACMYVQQIPTDE